MQTEILIDIKKYINYLKNFNIKVNLISRNIKFELEDNFFNDLDSLLKLQMQYLLTIKSIKLQSGNLKNKEDLSNKDISQISYATLIKEYENLLNTLENKYNSSSIAYHILNSAQIYSVILANNFKYDGSYKIADIGSGNGFPGIIIAILFKYNYLFDMQDFSSQSNFNFNVELFLCDCSIKKAEFLSKTNQDLNLKATIISKPIQESEINYFDLLISRAFSSKVSLFKAIEKIIYLELIILKSKDFNINSLYSDSKQIKKINKIDGFASNIIQIYTKFNNKLKIDN